MAFPAPRAGDPVPGRSPARLIALLAVTVLAALGWIVLAAMVADHASLGMAGHAGHGGHGGHGSGPFAALGPGMGLLDRLLPAGEISPFAMAAIAAICRPSFGVAPLASVMAEAVSVVAMWVAMVAAMMLPTAIPMVLAAAEPAPGPGRPARLSGPLLVLAGYGAVWVALAVVAAAAQMAISRIAMMDSAMATASPLFAAAIFLMAGAYQFSSWKTACVTQCQRPGPFFAGHIAEKPSEFFRLGLRQGLFCVGCCAPMMALMFAVGAMNIVWMAGLGAIMAAEKIAETVRFSRYIGAAIIAIGVAIAATAIIARWPAG